MLQSLDERIRPGNERNKRAGPAEKSGSRPPAGGEHAGVATAFCRETVANKQDLGSTTSTYYVLYVAALRHNPDCWVRRQHRRRPDVVTWHAKTNGKINPSTLSVAASRVFTTAEAGRDSRESLVRRYLGR